MDAVGGAQAQHHGSASNVDTPTQAHPYPHPPITHSQAWHQPSQPCRASGTWRRYRVSWRPTLPSWRSSGDPGSTRRSSMPSRLESRSSRFGSSSGAALALFRRYVNAAGVSALDFVCERGARCPWCRHWLRRAPRLRPLLFNLLQLWAKQRGRRGVPALAAGRPCMHRRCGCVWPHSTGNRLR